MKSILIISFLLLMNIYAEKKEQGDFIVFDHPKRPKAIRESDDLVLAGRDSYRDADFKQAVMQYHAAIEKLYQFDHALVENRYHSYTMHYAQAAIMRNKELLKMGKHAESTQLLLSVIALDPTNKDALKELNSRFEKLPPQFYLYQAIGHLRNKNSIKSDQSLSAYIQHLF